MWWLGRDGRRYWDQRPAEMQRRWALFISVTAPFLTRLVRDFSRGTIMSNEGSIARDLRVVLEKLGPTFVKLGQALSIRPDVVGPAATEELSKLQDAVPPFSNEVALALLDKELGRSHLEVFSEISPKPIAAASLAQVRGAYVWADAWRTSRRGGRCTRPSSRRAASMWP
jgi:aarF domain-containing kinase